MDEQPSFEVGIDLFAEGGWSAIEPAPRGRSTGDGRLLSSEQESSVRRTICDKRPEQLKMEFALWTRAAVMQFIERERQRQAAFRLLTEWHRQCPSMTDGEIRKAREVGRR